MYPPLQLYILTDFNSGTRGLQTKCRAYTDGSQDWDSNWKKLERWYRENDNTSEEPEIIFPVQVIYEDETLTINSAEELKELEEDCKED